ncbi:hypothetical protein EWM64_g4232 [Hericium alpestre]|uniref:Cyclase n=1 Tax=Hericium alpestre TaxID=135208 RepID=A0A4Y9ZY18_9AGAM|nr:hypothetical protein EWM64_g4232 [Hericium alpestre]
MASAPKGKKIIDLSQPLTTTGGSYCNGHPHFTCERICNIAAHGSNVSHISFGSHTGTHVDAPVHFFDTGASIGEVDISLLVGPPWWWMYEGGTNET